MITQRMFLLVELQQLDLLIQCLSFIFFIQLFTEASFFPFYITFDSVFLFCCLWLSRVISSLVGDLGYTLIFFVCVSHVFSLVSSNLFFDGGRCIFFFSRCPGNLNAFLCIFVQGRSQPTQSQLIQIYSVD